MCCLPGVLVGLVVVALTVLGSGVDAAMAAVGKPTAPQSVSATPATDQAQVSWSAPGGDGGSPITGYTVTPYVQSVAQSPVAVGNATATSAIVSGLTNGTPYTFTVTANHANGNGPASAASPAVTPEDTMFDFSGPPQLVDSGDDNQVEVGVRFQSDVDGWVTGVRFYKAAANRGPPGGFAGSVDNSPLHALANSTGGNGVYVAGLHSNWRRARSGIKAWGSITVLWSTTVFEPAFPVPAGSCARVSRRATKPGSTKAPDNRHEEGNGRVLHRRFSESRWPRPCVGDP
ncbi:MAG: fibronectin type III domain-containing protein [Solirubrobacteraceae bacterium]